MNQEALIKELGEQLDRHVFPSVRTGGVLVPAALPGADLGAGLEQANAKSQSRGSTTGSRKGSARRQRSSGRSTNSASPSVSEQLRRRYEAQLDELERAYPGTQIWPREDGMWLSVSSSIIEGLERAATFLLWVPYIGGIVPRAWGFWESGGSLTWIGPRHTNFPDGSICSYTPEDGTWEPGGSILTLIDLYTLWAFRHLHLEIFKRWPGYHTAPHPYERMLEFKENEFCGCGSLGLLYSECCKPTDFKMDIAMMAADFRKRYACQLNERRPPCSVQSFINFRADLPTATALMLELEDMSRQA